MSEKALKPVEQKEVEFYGDELTAVRGNDEHIYVGTRQICLALDLDAQGQRQCMSRHAVLINGLKVVDNLSTTLSERRAYMLRQVFKSRYIRNKENSYQYER